MGHPRISKTKELRLLNQSKLVIKSLTRALFFMEKNEGQKEFKIYQTAP